MTTYRTALKELTTQHARQMANLKAHRRIFTIAKKYAEATVKFLNINITYMEDTPSVDIDICLGKKDAIKSVYPLIDALIREPGLEMTEPLPAEMESTDSTLRCVFVKKGETSFPCLRVYIYASQSRVCVNVGTGKYKEITRVACGHYEDRNFVEDTNEDNQQA